MPTSHRLLSALFTTLPGFVFFLLFLSTGWIGRDYWWSTYLAVLIALLIASFLLGFSLPGVLHFLKVRQPWMWILTSGLMAWAIALILLGALNMTSLCVGQNNGDGSNDLAMCIFMTALSGIVYTPFYFGMLAVSALIGHSVLSSRPVTGIQMEESFKQRKRP